MVTGGGSRHYTRFIPSEEIGADAVTQWRFGAVDGSDLLPLPVPQEVVEVAAPMVDEAEHLTAFDSLLNQHRVRPTLLAPVWRAAGFALGVGTALMGEKAAHACTEAVETVIEEHYAAHIKDRIDASAINVMRPKAARTAAKKSRKNVEE